MGVATRCIKCVWQVKAEVYIEPFMAFICSAKARYTVLDIKRVENAFFHSMYIFSVILHAIDKHDIST